MSAIHFSAPSNPEVVGGDRKCSSEGRQRNEQLLHRTEELQKLLLRRWSNAVLNAGTPRAP